jgi:tape measure domain-containing protein
MNEVDKRVVQMEFDNKKFEQNVSETIKSLQKLDEALKINSSTDGLEKTGKSAHKLDKELSNVNDTLVDTRDHFSAIEVIGVTALATLTNSAVKAGAKIARSFNKPLSLAISGGKSRSQNIANAKFMLEGLGVEWEKISDDINYGVKSTAYGLDAAAKVASQLVASNVSLGENMRNSLRAVSGVAAMTNSTYEEIGEIFTTVAGQGKLMTMQLRQLEARGLNVAASLGKVMNKTESEIRDMVTAGKIGFQDFANAMDEAFGAHAKEANKTFSGALSNTKAALSRLGEAFATPTFEAVRRVLNSLIPIIDKISKQLKPLVAIYTNIIDGIAGVFEKIGTNLKYSDLIEKMGYAFYTWIAAIRTALRVVGVEMPDVFTGIRTINKLVDKFTLSGKKADTVVKIFATFFQTIKLINTVIKSIWKIAFPILNLAVKLLGIIFGVSGDFFEILYQVEGKLIQILDVVSSLIAVGLGEAINVIITLLSAIKFEYIIKALHVILGIVAALASVVMQLAGVLVVLVGGLVAGIPAVLSSILGVFGDLMGGANVITDLIRSVFGRKKKTTLSVDTEGLADAEDVEKTANAVKNLNKHLPTTEKNARGISKAVSAVSKEVKTLNKETTKVTNNAEKSARTVNKSLGGLKESLTDIVPQNDHSKKNEEDGSVIQRATGDADRAKYYADKAKAELDKNEKESKNAFQRFFSHIVDVLKAGGNLIKTAVMGVIGVIAFAFSKMAEIIKSLNWFKIIGIAAVGIAVFIVYEILRAIHSIISAFAAIGNLAKGYADRGAALKFHAMAGVILAFGAVLVALMITIDKVGTNKLVAGLRH